MYSTSAGGRKGQGTDGSRRLTYVVDLTDVGYRGHVQYFLAPCCGGA